MDLDAVWHSEWGPSRYTGVLDGGRDRRRGRGSSGVELDAPHCN